jgi:L-arabonate dehydrase
VAENLTHARPARRRDVVATLGEPFGVKGGIVILRGNLCPDGAVVKQTAASPDLARHRGRAVVFSSMDDLRQRIDDPMLDVEPADVEVLMPIPRKLLERGVRDMVRISDARMSDTSYGTVVLHVAPESAIGGPLALLRTGDAIVLDIPARSLTFEVAEHELIQRRAA